MNPFSVLFYLLAAVVLLSTTLAVTRRQPVETGALLGYQVGLRTSTQT